MVESGIEGPWPAIAVWASLLAALVLGVAALLGRRPARWTLALLAAVELVLAGFLGAVIAQWGGGVPDRPFIFVLYLVATLAVAPLAALWSAVETSRWGTLVLTVACLTIAVLVVRMQQVWAGG